MKSTLLLLTVVVLMTGGRGLVGNIKAGEWGPVTNNLQMSLRLQCAQVEIKTNEPVRLLIQVRNVSTNEVIGIPRPKEAIEKIGYFSFDVVSPSGRDISPASRPKPYYGSARFLAPGHSEDFKVDLSRICNLEEIGTYKIIARRTETRTDIRTKEVIPFGVRSNPLYVSVVADK